MELNKFETINRVNSSVVLHDPKNEYWLGAFVPSRYVPQLEDRGVVMIPVYEEHARGGGLSGYVHRAWGPGLSLNTVGASMVGSLSLFVEEELHTLNYVVALIPDASCKVQTAHGFLKLVPDASQRATIRCGFSNKAIQAEAINLNIENRTLEDGPIIIKGSSGINAANDGYLGLSFYGRCPGLRLLWAAVSLTA